MRRQAMAVLIAMLATLLASCSVNTTYSEAERRSTGYADLARTINAYPRNILSPYGDVSTPLCQTLSPQGLDKLVAEVADERAAAPYRTGPHVRGFEIWTSAADSTRRLDISFSDDSQCQATIIAYWGV